MAGTVLGQFHLTGWGPWLMPFDSLPCWMAHVSASLIISPVAFVVFTVLAGRRLAYCVPALGVEPSIELCMCRMSRRLGERVRPNPRRRAPVTLDANARSTEVPLSV